jgi:hypothetical protein
MQGMIAVSDWLGRRGEPIEPEALQFVTRQAQSCRNCLFDGQTYAVCARAGKAALRASLEDCGEAHVIYVAKEIDPRQITIE